jgi:polar amino acid transport system ATP-binding protein
MLRRLIVSPDKERHRTLGSDDKRFCKSPGHSQVLKDILRDVEQGRVTTLPGASGSGESTFLRCLN